MAGTSPAMTANGSFPNSRRKFLVDVLTPIQHTHDFRRAVDDAIENNVRGGGKGMEPRAHFVSRTTRKRVVFLTLAVWRGAYCLE